MKKNFTTILFIASFLFFKTNITDAQINTQDSLALVDFYNSTHGPDWHINDNWLTSAPVSTWHGVYINSTRVTGLILEQNNLRGKLPASIGKLTKLTTLNLSFNNTIHDTIPASLGKLVNLNLLALKNNNLTGGVPSQLGKLTKLTTLDLSYNNIAGNIPAELSNLTNLSQLFLENNKLDGSIPVFLGNLINLTYLSLQNNNFTGVIPPQLGNLSNLISLNLSGNALTGSIPVELGNLSQVQYFNLSADHLSGNLPVELGNLSSVNGLYLAANQFTGNIPASFGNLSQLDDLNLNSNQLSGTIPSSFVNLKQIENLVLSANQLSGNIPSFLGKLPRLYSIYIDHNQFSGAIPSSLINLKPEINLAYNRFTFAGMETLVKALDHLTYSPQANVVLNNNNNTLSVYAGGANALADNTYKWYKGSTLVATITGDSTYQPTISGNYHVAITNSVATALTLYSDSVYVRTTINKNDSLALVDLYNSTNGPNWHGHLNWLTSAPVSTWYGVTVTGNHVTELHLGLDNLGGKIPSSIGNLTQLNYLDFSYGHNLHGTIPASIGKLTNLSYINLNSCKLSGAIPESAGNLVKLEILYLNDNNLSEEIPSSLGNLANLKMLDIGFNKLSGVIPSQLTKLTKLTNLILLYNNFTFAGMGKIATAFPFAVYSPQALIPLHLNNNVLSVTAGSSVNNNTYKWYKNGMLYKTKVGDSTITINGGGDYYVAVTNSIATQLTLYSDTINYSTGNNAIAFKMNNNSSISVYPNPAKTNATVSFYADGKYSITVTDFSGKILQTKAGVANKGINIIQVDVSKYANGVYSISIIDEKNERQTLRLSKE